MESQRGKKETHAKNLFGDYHDDLLEFGVEFNERERTRSTEQADTASSYDITRQVIHPAPAPSREHLLKCYPGLFPQLEKTRAEKVAAERNVKKVTRKKEDCLHGINDHHKDHPTGPIEKIPETLHLSTLVHKERQGQTNDLAENINYTPLWHAKEASGIHGKNENDSARVEPCTVEQSLVEQLSNFDMGRGELSSSSSIQHVHSTKVREDDDAVRRLGSPFPITDPAIRATHETTRRKEK